MALFPTSGAPAQGVADQAAQLPRGGLGGLGGFLNSPQGGNVMQALGMSLMGSPRNAPLQNFGQHLGQLQQMTLATEKDARAQAQAGQERQALKSVLVASGIDEGEAEMLSANPAAAKLRLDQIATERATQRDLDFLSSVNFGGSGDYGIPADAPRIAEPSDDSWTALGQQYGWAQPGARPDTQIAQAAPQEDQARPRRDFVTPEMRDLLERERRYSQALLSAPSEGARKAVESQLDYTRKQIDRLKPTDTQKNLEWRAREAGLEPGTKEFRDFMLSGGSGPQTTITNVVGAEGDPYQKKFWETMAGADAKSFTDAIESGDQARRNRINLDRLSQLSLTTPQGMEGAVINALGEYGIKTEGLDNVQAMNSLISQLVPTQRPPGSGTISDADLKLYQASLPRLINSPEGNKLILETMYAINDHDIAAAEIASRVAAGELTPAQARKEMRLIPNPFDDWRDKVNEIAGESGGDGKASRVPASSGTTSTNIPWSFEE